MDRTSEWISAIDTCCIKLQLAPDKVTLIKSSLLLRPTRKPSQFATVSNAVSSAIRDLSEMINTHSKGYLSSYSNAEKESLESEVSMVVQTCSQQIEKLKDSILRAQQQQGGGLNGQTVAHLHGMVLVLAEGLQRASASFDSLRAQRYRQKAKEEEARRLAAQQYGAGTRSGGGGGVFSSGLTSFLGSKKQQMITSTDNQASNLVTG
jgi:syntaxin 18